MKKIICFMFVFMLCFSFMTVSFASDVPSDVPDFSNLVSDFEQYNHEFIISRDEGHWDYILYYVYETIGMDQQGYYFDVKVNPNSYATITLTNGIDNAKFNYRAWYYKNGQWNSWKSSSSSGAQTSFVTDINTPLYSTLTLYSENGDVFFQTPPATLEGAVAQMVAEEMTTFPEMMAQKMRTLVLCGVGCLALLISLVLLVKVLRRYLPR